MFKYSITNIIINTPVMSYQIITILNIYLVVKIFYLLQFLNKNKYLTVVIYISAIIFLNYYDTTHLILFIFVLITELTSIYLLTVTTLNINYFKNFKFQSIWLYGLLLILFNPSYLTYYCYFNYYTTVYIGDFNQFLVLLNSQFIYYLMILIIALTLFLLYYLIPSACVNFTNLVSLFTNITSVINQIPLNLNLFTSPTLLKWL